MSKQDDIAAAELAGMVGGHLRGVVNSMTQRSSTDAGVQIDPRQFLGSHMPAKVATTNNAIIARDLIIDPPKSTSAGSEIVGVENINVEDLMIPMDGMDREMREAIQRYAKPEPVRPPVIQQAQITPQQPQIVVGSVTPIQSAPTASASFIAILERIESKLDILLKRAKVAPRYKEPKTVKKVK